MIYKVLKDNLHDKQYSVEAETWCKAITDVIKNNLKGIIMSLILFSPGPLIRTRFETVQVHSTGSDRRTKRRGSKVRIQQSAWRL